jgi:hypothetical protein
LIGLFSESFKLEYTTCLEARTKLTGSQILQFNLNDEIFSSFECPAGLGEKHVISVFWLEY